MKTIPIQTAGETPFQRFDNLFKAVIAVPKAAIDKREKKYTKSRVKVSRTGPKPKAR
jgi:hypothetical protein